jgi:hypothetical protein
MELSIAKFDPQKAEVLALVANVKSTIVSLPAGNTGYALMRENKSLLQKKRTDLTRMFKDERAGALAYQKGIIKIEKDLLGLMAPVEMDLDAKISKIDEENARAKRVKDLPERMERLKLIECEAEPDQLLGMDDNQFLEFFNQMKLEYLDKREQAIKTEAERKEKERLAAEEKKAFELAEAETKRQAEADKKEAERLAGIEKEERERQALIKAENDKLEMERIIIKDQQEEIEREKQIIADQKAAEEWKKQRDIELDAAKKKAAEDEAKRIESARVVKEAEAKRVKEEMEKQAKYQNFLKDNNFNPDTDKIESADNKVTLYRKIAEIII